MAIQKMLANIIRNGVEGIVLIGHIIEKDNFITITFMMIKKFAFYVLL